MPVSVDFRNDNTQETTSKVYDSGEIIPSEGDKIVNPFNHQEIAIVHAVSVESGSRFIIHVTSYA
jgi:hypothetical protein